MLGLNYLDTPDGGIVSARSQLGCILFSSIFIHLPHYLPLLILRQKPRRLSAAAWHPAERITLLFPVVLREPPEREEGSARWPASDDGPESSNVGMWVVPLMSVSICETESLGPS